MNCRNLKSVGFLTEELNSIPDDTFNGCSSLEDIVLPNTIKRVGKFSLHEYRKIGNPPYSCFR